jgi:hypothetical protein
MATAALFNAIRASSRLIITALDMAADALALLREINKKGKERYEEDDVAAEIKQRRDRVKKYKGGPLI